MGTALINAHRFASLGPKGSRIAIDSDLDISRLDGVISKNINNYTIIDWVHSETLTYKKIIDETKIKVLSKDVLEKKFHDYIVNNDNLRESEWGRDSIECNNIKKFIYKS